MKYCHRTLEIYKSKKDNYDKILEIGAGSAPHYKFIKHKYKEYHIAETSKICFKFSYQDNIKVKF
jgi:hypothetical protein